VIELENLETALIAIETDQETIKEDKRIINKDNPKNLNNKHQNNKKDVH
jgi:hypothetical protein